MQCPIAIVSSRRAGLVQLAKAGGAGARHALRLASEPTRFLSSVQVGITSIGILSGAIREARLATRLRMSLEQVPVLGDYAETLSLGIIVVALTYVSLILGELVPKRLALTHPERIASLIARPMDVLATIGPPLVYFLTVSTDTILHLLGVRHVKQPAVTVEEIKVLFEQGTEEGVFEQTEREMVTNVLNLDERLVGAILTPRSDVDFLDIRDAIDGNREKLRRNPHSVLPLCDGGLERVLGFVRATTVHWKHYNENKLGLTKRALFPPFVGQVVDELNAPGFVTWLSELTGIQGLVATRPRTRRRRRSTPIISACGSTLRSTLRRQAARAISRRLTATTPPGFRC